MTAKKPVKKTAKTASPPAASATLGRALRLYILGCTVIALGALIVAIVAVSYSSGEHDRQCRVAKTSIHLVLDAVFFKVPATRTKSLPPRTAEEQAAFRDQIDNTNREIDAALEKC